MEPAPVLAEALGDGVDERGDVVVRLALDLGHALRRTAAARRTGSRATASPGTTPTSPQPSSAASSTSSHPASFASSDQIWVMAGRE